MGEKFLINFSISPTIPVRSVRWVFKQFTVCRTDLAKTLKIKFSQFQIFRFNSGTKVEVSPLCLPVSVARQHSFLTELVGFGNLSSLLSGSAESFTEPRAEPTSTLVPCQISKFLQISDDWYLSIWRFWPFLLVLASSLILPLITTLTRRTFHHNSVKI